MYGDDLDDEESFVSWGNIDGLGGMGNFNPTDNRDILEGG